MVKIVLKDDPTVCEILAKAKEVFQQYGYKKTTMEDIARSMGKGKSTLYYYFVSKEDIFEKVVDKEMASFFTHIEKAIEKSKTAREKLKSYGEMRLKRIDEMCNLSHALKNDLIENLGIVLEIKRKHDLTHTRIVKRIIDFGIQEGEFKKITSGEVNLISILFVSLFKGMELPMNTGKVEPNLYKLAELMVDIFVEGIGKKI
jgi:AcrR family transcriptional regulator